MGGRSPAAKSISAGAGKAPGGEGGQGLDGQPPGPFLWRLPSRSTCKTIILVDVAARGVYTPHMKKSSKKGARAAPGRDGAAAQEKPDAPSPAKINLVAEAKRIGITRGAMGQRVRAWERQGLSRSEARSKACEGTPTSGGAVKRKPPRGTGDVARRARMAGLAPSTVYKRMAGGKTPEEAIAMGKHRPGPMKGTPRPPRGPKPTESWDPVAL